MQEKYLEFKLGAPDYVTVETEEERLVCQGGSSAVTAGSTTVEFEDAGEHEDIFVTSEDAVELQDPEICKIFWRRLGTYIWRYGMAWNERKPLSSMVFSGKAF